MSAYSCKNVSTATIRIDVNRILKRDGDRGTGMPSTLVHVAVAVLVGAALLTDEFDRRSISVVAAAAVIPDLDTFVGLVVPGAHRALFHTLLLPTAVAGFLLVDARRGDESWIRRRYGRRGVRVAWVALAGLTFGGILPDLFTNGVNVFYPLHDAFYAVNGELLLSNQRGVVQTFVEVTPDAATRTTKNTHYWTGVDPTPGADPSSVERIFPVVESGTQLLLVLLAGVTLVTRGYRTR